MSQPAVITRNSTDTSRREDAERLFPLPHTPAALATVRRHARSVLTGWGLLQENVDDAVLVLSELINNAVTHALPPAYLRLSHHRTRVGGTLSIEVVDAGPAATLQADPRHSEEHGRGITIVTALCARHGTRPHPGGATWWAELHTP
ncbi:ATP-binding protein [Streptomyces coffeae]|uniref:ATP-binding protein n=1 Tax=Streptomyces coffeae TaxID=621382 RepID=A0ABS1NNS6_9ACTN|nr:ATP-binding protein [Streptomyces coffeae]MBL1101733.1 ATP-binding protein [Streptomyces coffeae]